MKFIGAFFVFIFSVSGGINAKAAELNDYQIDYNNDHSIVVTYDYGKSFRIPDGYIEKGDNSPIYKMYESDKLTYFLIQYKRYEVIFILKQENGRIVANDTINTDIDKFESKIKKWVQFFIGKNEMTKSHLLDFTKIDGNRINVCFNYIKTWQISNLCFSVNVDDEGRLTGFDSICLNFDV